nr:hypothetical protein [Tanacetum cinerariifolium]
MQILEEKQIDTESMQELLLQLSKDLQTLGNTSNQLKHEVQDSSQYWKPPIYYSDDGGDFYRESIDVTPPSDAIAPDLSITDSLVMDDEHLDTILEMDSDKEIESNDYTSSDDESSSEEDVPVEHFKSYSNPLLEFNEEIFSSEINQLYNEVLEDLDPIPLGKEDDHFRAESSLIESLLNKDTMITSLKIDYLLEEFTGELALINLVPLRIAETNFDTKNSGSTTIHTDIYLPEYESFYDENDSTSEIFNHDLAHIISPSEYEYVYADDESDSGDLTTKLVDDIYDNSTRELYVHVPNVLTTLPTLYPVFDTLLPLLSKNKDKTFNPGILISKEEKSPPLLSHQGLKVIHFINDSESSMMIYGGVMQILDVSYFHYYPP